MPAPRGVCAHLPANTAASVWSETPGGFPRAPTPAHPQNNVWLRYGRLPCTGAYSDTAARTSHLGQACLSLAGECRWDADDRTRPSTRADPDAALAKQVDVGDTLVAELWAGRVAGKGGAFPLTPVRGNIAYSTG